MSGVRGRRIMSTGGARDCLTLHVPAATRGIRRTERRVALSRYIMYVTVYAGMYGTCSRRHDRQS